MRTTLTWSERFAQHDMGDWAIYVPPTGLVEPDVHLDNPKRTARLRLLIAKTGLEERLDPVVPRAATPEEIETVHSAEHVARMRAVSAAGGGDAGGGFTPMDGESYELALLGAGSAITAVEHVASGRADNAYALVRRAGHHAWRDSGFGFCIFNNVAVAARFAQHELGVDRVAIVDIDVHHGNGTEAIFAEDPSVLTISLHQERMFPPDSGDADVIGAGDGRGANVNLPLPPGTGDEAYHRAIDRAVAPVLHAFGPDLLLVACGLDASLFDPMARLAVTARGYGGIARRLLDAAAELCGGRAVFVQEGGYSPVYAPFCGMAVIEALAAVAEPHEDPFEPFIAPVVRQLADYQREAVDALVEHHAAHWEVLDG
jgi:acetoin utilization deacetylase AcuC-like enzyme